MDIHRYTWVYLICILDIEKGTCRYALLYINSSPKLKLDSTKYVLNKISGFPV